MTTERDIRNQIAYSREEGRAEGKAEERRLIIEKLKMKGFSEEEIAELLS